MRIKNLTVMARDGEGMIQNVDSCTTNQGTLLDIKQTRHGTKGPCWAKTKAGRQHKDINGLEL